MAATIPPPEPSRLLPPLLAFLPTAFASRQPPPGLLDLVTPILRQRLEILEPSSPSRTWLQMMCWVPEKAEKLHHIVEEGTFEPHPSSGEIETGDVGPLKFRRIDEDTLRALLFLPDWDLIATYLWCMNTDGRGSWKLAELGPYDRDLELDPEWSSSIIEATESSQSHVTTQSLRSTREVERLRTPRSDDDDYWARYDAAPSDTPNPDPDPHPDTSIGRPSTDTTTDYFDRYNKVQPALDNHDPAEMTNNVANSAVQGDVLEGIVRQLQAGQIEPPPAPPISSTPSSPASPGVVAHLEGRALHQSASEVGIKQHITTTMKSLYRLAMTSGMDGDEFNRIVYRELETNSMVDF